MELFIIGHEYGHFVVHEHAPDYGQPLSIDDIHRLEFACDQIGVNLSRQATHRERHDWLGYCAAGAVAFFRAIEASDRARAMIKPEEQVRPSDHPTPEDRIAVIKETVRRRTDHDQAKAVIGTLNFYDALTRELGRLAVETFRGAQASDPKSPLGE